MDAAELSNYVMQQSMRQAERSEFVERSRTIYIDGVTMPMNEISRYIKNPSESYLRIMQNEIERLHQRISKPAPVADPVDKDSEYDHLYVMDELISRRIRWENVDKVEVKYYELDDLEIPWYKFYLSRYDVHKKKNTLLYHEAIAVARAKKLYRPMPPILYRDF
jgi:hypothetical protein